MSRHLDHISGVRAVARLARIFDRVLADVDLSLAQYRLLAFLGEGDSAASRLADYLGVSRPSVTSMVDSLSTKGLVAREHSSDDRRRVLHVITPAGQEILNQADEALTSRLEALADRTDGERLFSALTLLADALEAGRTTPA